MSRRQHSSEFRHKMCGAVYGDGYPRRMHDSNPSSASTPIRRWPAVVGLDWGVLVLATVICTLAAVAAGLLDRSLTTAGVAAASGHANLPVGGHVLPC